MMLPTAGTLAATGDVIATVALVTAAIALFSLIVVLLSRKVKQNKKSEWKYPF